MKKKWFEKIIPVSIALCVALGYLAFAKIAVETIIAQGENGEVVASMGPGILVFINYVTDTEPELMEPNRYKYHINVIEYRDPSGKTLARYKPSFAPHNIASASFTDRFVLISSELNGECPEFVALNRVTGERIDQSSEELLALPSETQLHMDPCGIGRDEYEEWKKRNPQQNQ